MRRAFAPCQWGSEAAANSPRALRESRPVGGSPASRSARMTHRLITWQPRQLAVGDRVYCNPPWIRAVVERGADVLVRLNRGALCKPSGEPFDLMTWLRSLHGNTASETDVVTLAVCVSTSKGGSFTSSATSGMGSTTTT